MTLILGYHRVNPAPRGDLSITTNMFRRQLLYLLRRGYHNVSLSDIATTTQRPPRRSFAITFDDGYRDNYLHVMPVLSELGLTATLFVTVGYVDTDQPYPWDEERRAGWGGDRREEDLCVTWAQLESMQDSGVFTIGSHTLTHPELPAVDPATARHEISMSRSILEERLRRPVTAFCYPRGELSREVIAMVQVAGYRVGVVTPDRPVPRSGLTLHRVGVYATTTERDFALKVSPPFQAMLTSGIWPRIASARKRFERRYSG